MLFAWQAQGFSWFVMSIFEALDADSVEGLQVSCHGNVLLCRDDFAWQLQELVCLGSTFLWQAQYF